MQYSPDTPWLVHAPEQHQPTLEVPELGMEKPETDDNTDDNSRVPEPILQETDIPSSTIDPTTTNLTQIQDFPGLGEFLFGLLVIFPILLVFCKNSLHR